MQPLVDRSLVLVAVFVATLAFAAQAEQGGNDSPTGGVEGAAVEEQAKEGGVDRKAPRNARPRGHRNIRGQRRPPRGFPAGLAEARLVKEKAKELGVGQETLDKLDAMAIEARAKEEQLNVEVRESDRKVAVLLDEGRPNEKTVLEAAAVGSGISRQTRELRLRISLQVRQLLSDEQLVKFMEMRTKAMEARRKRAGQRPRR